MGGVVDARARRARARPGDRDRRDRVGTAAAVAPDAPASVRPGILVALRGAAAVRRARRRALPAGDRAGTRPGHRGGELIVAGIEPKAEMVHWCFASGIRVLGLLLIVEVAVGLELVVCRASRI